eukprot:scaffold282337_cov22-Prasinocladus_malaysianus.AAC.1
MNTSVTSVSSSGNLRLTFYSPPDADWNEDANVTSDELVLLALNCFGNAEQIEATAVQATDLSCRPRATRRDQLQCFNDISALLGNTH